MNCGDQICRPDSTIVDCGYEIVISLSLYDIHLFSKLYYYYRTENSAPSGSFFSFVKQTFAQ